jgi:signal transduction histidine kinase
VGVVSHELRTPITTIYGMSQILLSRFADLDTEMVAERISDIHAEADRLSRLTEDLLVLSRAEGGRLQVGDDPLVLRHVVAAAIDAERARGTGHDIRLRVDGDLPLVLGEETYVGQVVRNLVGNAAKYSPAGTTIAVALVAADDGASVLVTDEGPGIQPPTDRLFDLFYRAPGTSRGTHGAGIGLFVCRELVTAMGGRIWARPLERGSEFGFWLPAASATTDDEDTGSDREDVQAVPS